MSTPNSAPASLHVYDPQSVNKSWNALRNQFPDFLISDVAPIYAIPDSLIDALLDNSRDFLTARELDFERTLAGLVMAHHAIGIDDGQLICSSLFESHPQIHISADDFEALGWAQFGLTHDKVNKLCDETKSCAHMLRDQLAAYAGWLITNPQFLHEVFQLRDQEANLLREDKHRSAADVFAAFCSRWQLAGMSSWDLPIPQGPNLSGLEAPLTSRASEQTVTLQMPLSMRLPARFPIGAVVNEIRRGLTQNHLHEWQAVLSQEGERHVGFERFQHILWLQFYRNVVLASRYGSRLRGRVEVTDRAFGQFLGSLGEDSVKRLRTEIRRRLSRETPRPG